MKSTTATITKLLSAPYVRRMLVLFGALLCTLLSGTAHASAKSPMCSDSAESIAAPPPLYAATDSVATGCDESEDFSLQAAPSNDNAPRLASVNDAGQNYAILSAPLIFVLEDVVQRYRPTETKVGSSEHLRKLPRPPCAV